MKVICVKETLMKGIQTVSPVAASKTSLPVLSNFAFETNEDKIKLSATDLEISIECYIKGEIIEEGSITIPAKRFLDIIKELPQDSQIEIIADESKNQILIKSGKSKFTLMGISYNEYPVIPKFQKENTFEIPKKVFLPMLKKTIFSVSKDVQRYQLTGIYLAYENNVLKMVATDGRRLAYCFNNVDVKLKAEAIVPSKAIVDAIRLLTLEGEDENVKMCLAESRFYIEFDGIVILSTLIEGIFPSYEQVIPKDIENTARINVKETLQAVKQMVPFTNENLADKTSSLKFVFEKNALKLLAAAPGIGSGEYETEVEYKGSTPAEISFNLAFIKDVLQNIDEEWAEFKFSSKEKPALISPENDKNYICVVMPVRV
jgi:DNA polymerase-3 subunit beta